MTQRYDRGRESPFRLKSPSALNVRRRNGPEAPVPPLGIKCFQNALAARRIGGIISIRHPSGSVSPFLLYGFSTLFVP